MIFDFARCIGSKINYSVVEQLKNGYIFSSKYYSGLKMFQPPHVVIFANIKPDHDAYSEDRVELINLNSLENG